MQIFVACSKEQEEEILCGIDKKNHLVFAKYLPEKNEYQNYDAFFIFSKTDASLDFDLFENKPVFINQVTKTLFELNYPQNFARINAWPGFLQRKIWEIVSNDVPKSENIWKQIGRKPVAVKDEPGLVSARVVSMIINEAFFAIGEKISTKEEIDMAMKLGTNYPFGPFEWAEKIGIENIYDLLETLAKKEERYLPAKELKEEFFRKRK
jgi:3-hydroxybutyryl-CoA dehydrogenase